MIFLPKCIQFRLYIIQIRLLQRRMIVLRHLKSIGRVTKVILVHMLILRIRLLVIMISYKLLVQCVYRVLFQTLLVLIQRTFLPNQLNIKTIQMGQCNQVCQLPFAQLDLNQVKMIDPQLLEVIHQFRAQNQQNSQKIAKNCNQNSSYQEVFTSEYLFFGCLAQGPNNKLLECEKVLRINGKLPHGEGIFIHRYRLYYKGNFKLGLMHGQGIQKTQQWSFQGQFSKGYRKNGKFKNNIFLYQGSFNNNQISGKGKIKWENGNMYGGQFMNGKMHGKGKLIYSNGDQYEGEFKQNYFQGEGTYIWKNGAIYKGKYKLGMKHGFGVLHSNGQKHACCWINNQPVAKPLTYKQFQAKKTQKENQLSKSRKQIVDLTSKTHSRQINSKRKTQVLLQNSLNT